MRFGKRSFLASALFSAGLLSSGVAGAASVYISSAPASSQATTQGQPLTLSYSFAATDNLTGVSGTLDWGDGTLDPFNVTNSFVDTHAYAAAGNYNVILNAIGQSFHYQTVQTGTYTVFVVTGPFGSGHYETYPIYQNLPFNDAPSSLNNQVQVNVAAAPSDPAAAPLPSSAVGGVGLLGALAFFKHRRRAAV